MSKESATYNGSDELLLLSQIAEGDKAAFMAVYDKYHKGIYRYCALMLNDKFTADDIYQEVFFTFYKNCREGKNVQSIQGYLIAIARSRCLDYLSRNKRYVPLEVLPEASYEIDVEQNDTGTVLYQALSSIPEQYREAFVLFTLKEYSYAEIEKFLGVSRNVVKNRIYRAKQGLQKILGPLLDDSAGDNKPA